MPVSQLSVRRSLLSANLHLASLDTPKGWLQKIVPYLPPGSGGNVLRRTRQQQQDDDRCSGERGTGGAGYASGAGDTGVGGNGGDHGGDGSRKRDHDDTQVRNMDIHPILQTMTQPVLDIYILLSQCLL